MQTKHLFCFIVNAVGRCWTTGTIHTFSPMALIIRDRETEHLATEVAFLMGESETGAVQLALREAFDRRTPEPGPRRGAAGNLRTFLETEIWPLVPDAELDRPEED